MGMDEEMTDSFFRNRVGTKPSLWSGAVPKVTRARQLTL